jgi:hypothetical protein
VPVVSRFAQQRLRQRAAPDPPSPAPRTSRQCAPPPAP